MALGAKHTWDMIAVPSVGVWNVTDVEEVDFLGGMSVRGPRWNLADHHLLSVGRDSVGLDVEDVAKAMDLVVGAWSEARLVDFWNVVMMLMIL